MSVFNLSDKMSKIYDESNKIKSSPSRIMSILDFDERVLNMAYDTDTPILERINFIKIVSSNLDEFISIKYSECNDSLMIKTYQKIEDLYQTMENLLCQLREEFNIVFGYDNTEMQDKCSIEDEGLYMIYLDEQAEFHIAPYVTSAEKTIERIHSMGCDKVMYSFLVRFISDKTFEYTYAGEDDYTVLQEIEALTLAKGDLAIKYIQTTCTSDDIMEEFIHFLDIGELTIFHTGVNTIRLSRLTTSMACDEKYGLYQKLDIGYELYDYSKELLNRDILFRTPYESYDHVLDFIDQMCTSNSIETIFMTMYRVKANSKIVQSLIKAKQSGKKVFVYVEVTARGNEELNRDIIKILMDNKIQVLCTCHNVKVHAKMFCAVDKSGMIYTHISTGNYSESNARIYTDFQLLTTNKLITKPVMLTFVQLFTDNIMQLDKYQTSDFALSPIGLRTILLNEIYKETMKGKSGRILIKCNSLCDPQIISRLYQASECGVKIKIICRTGCSIKPTENIEIISKVGRFLQHDRFYIFGEDAYISSADMLTRNLDKRIEAICRITDSSLIQKMFDEFIKIWNDPKVYHLSNDGWYIKET